MATSMILSLQIALKPIFLSILRKFPTILQYLLTHEKTPSKCYSLFQLANTTVDTL